MCGFICSLTPLRARNGPSGYPVMWRIEKESRKDVLIREEVEGDKQTRTWADQEREKRISHDGREIVYIEWKTTQTRAEVSRLTNDTRT
jgi:hypothetical protein